MVKKLLCCLSLFALVSCISNNEYLRLIADNGDNVDHRFKNSNHDEIVVHSDSDNYLVYFGADVHTIKTANNLKKLITYERNDPDALFTVVLGDFVTQKGTMHISKEAMEFDPSTQAKADTVFTIIGNHDLFFNQWRDYKDLFNSSSYYVTVQTPNAKDLFIMLDSATATLGELQMNWFKKLLREKRKDYRYCVVCTHCHFFRMSVQMFLAGNYSIEETYEFNHIVAQNNVDFVIQGHQHSYEYVYYYDVEYVIVETLKDEAESPGYLILDIGEEGIDFDGYDFE